MYDMRKRRVSVAVAAANTLSVLCPARNVTIANANSITATQRSIELSKKGVAWLLSYNILNRGFPSISTAEPPLFVSGNTEYFPGSFR
jgi:hypothetical protein